MCLVAIAHHARQGLPLVLVANRDEFHARPTAPMAWWDEPRLLAGRDLLAGGTWFAVDERGRFGVVTNVRGVAAPVAAPSRGALVPRFVGGTLSPLAYLTAIAAEAGDYAGFNLLVGDRGGVAWFSNADGRPPHALPHGVHALSNGVPGTRWPKVRMARARLTTLLEGPEADDESLLQVLAARAAAPDSDLPDTGVGLDRERALSPPFIVGPDYGTRCTTVLVFDVDGGGRVLEQRHAPTGQALATRRFRLAAAR